MTISRDAVRKEAAQYLYEQLGSTYPGAVQLPPHATVTALSRPYDYAQVKIALPEANTVVSFGASTMAGLLTNRALPKNVQYIQRAATCATDFSKTYTEFDRSLQLPDILAGNGPKTLWSCGSLIKDVYKETNEPQPSAGALSTKLKSFATDFQANHLDDLLKKSQALVRIAPR